MIRLAVLRRALALGVLLVAAPLALAAGAEIAVRSPNVVFIMADDLGWGEVGCYGQEKIRTPGIDRIAREGIRFTQAYSGSPVCAPTRCMLMTGLHSGHAYVRDNREVGGWNEGDPEGQLPLPAGTTTIGTLFQAAGYATAAVGKWGLGGPGSTGEPLEQGFDHFYGYLCQRIAHNLYPTHLWRDGEKEVLEGNTWKNLTGEHYSHDLMAEDLLAWVRAHADRPFFLYVPFHIPHAAIQVPEDSLAEYRGLWEDPPYDGKKGYLPHPAPRAAYAAMVTRMDRDIGRLLDLLAELELDEDTIVFFTSDNGPTFNGGTDSTFFESAGPFRGLKGRVYEGGIRVPMVARWPGKIAPGQVSDHVLALWDVLPTLMDVAGLDTPAGLDGLSFAPTLLGEGAQPEHAFLYWEFPSYGHQQAVRAGDWKAVRKDIKKRGLVTELYDLANDVGETTDVAAQHPEIVARLEGIMTGARVPSKEFPFPALDGR